MKSAFAFYKDDNLLSEQGLGFIRDVARAAVRIEDAAGDPPRHPAARERHGVD